MKTILLIFTITAFSFLDAQIYINNSSKPTKNNTEGEIKIKSEPSKSSKSLVTISNSDSQNTNSSSSTPTIKSSTTNSSTSTTTKSNSLTSINNVNRQVASNDDLPPNAEPGKCYARCFVKDQYSYVSEQVIDKPQTVKKIKIPAQYETVYDTVVSSPQTTRMITKPAVYKTVVEDVVETPAITKWVKKKSGDGCLSSNPEDCEVMCLVQVPAKYKQVSKKVLVEPETTYEKIEPIQYKVKKKSVLVSAERYEEQVIPATYKTIQKKVLVKEGGYEDWREILCESSLTPNKIRDIQQALKSEGYNPGPIDNVFGAATRKALLKYQKDNNLPEGNLNIETLNLLGVY